MNKNTQIQKYYSLSLSKVQNRITITNKLLPSKDIEHRKKYWEDKLKELSDKSAWEDLITAAAICIDELPNWFIGYYHRGNAKYFIKDFKDSILDYDEAIKLDDSSVDAYWARGQAKETSKDYLGAVNDFTKVIEMMDDSEAPYYIRGRLWYKLGNYQKAIDDFTKEIDLNYNIAQHYFMRGKAKFELEDYDGAKDDFSKAIELDSTSALHYAMRSVTRHKMQDIEGAIGDMNKAIDLNQGNDDYNEIFSDLLKLLKKRRKLSKEQIQQNSKNLLRILKARQLAIQKNKEMKQSEKPPNE